MADGKPVLTGRAALDRWPHPAGVCSGPQLDQVIHDLEHGIIALPEEGPLWRTDLPEEQRARLARATGASDQMIADALAGNLAGAYCAGCGGRADEPAPGPGCADNHQQTEEAGR